MELRRGRHAGLLLAFVGLALAASPASCRLAYDPASIYDFAFQNYTDRPLTVSFASSTQKLRPCSVRQYGFLAPRYGTPIQLRISDEKGNPVLTREVKIPRQGSRPMRVTIGQPDTSPCPPAVDAYALTVHNEGTGAMEVWRERSLLGSVPPGARVRFGPFPGHWEDIGSFSIHDFRGKTFAISVTSLVVDYKLGELPEIVYFVR